MVGDGHLCLLPPISTGTLSGLDLCRLCARCPILCECMCRSCCVQEASLPWCPHPLWILQSSSSHRVPLSSEGRDIQRPFSVCDEGWAPSHGVSQIQLDSGWSLPQCLCHSNQILNRNLFYRLTLSSVTETSKGLLVCLF